MSFRIKFCTDEDFEVTFGEYVDGGRVETYDGPYEFTPTTETQTAETAEKMAQEDITINPIPSQYKDTSDATVTNHDMLDGVIGYGVNGKVTGDIPRKSASDITVNKKTVTTPAGYYANAVSKEVQTGTEGTPVATKGAVSNHSVTITPSVTNAEGYISGGTETGQAVTVSASELVSGSRTVDENGTYDVTNLAEMVVDAPIGEPILAVTVNRSNGTWVPDKTFAEIQDAWNSGKDIVTVSGSQDAVADGWYMPTQDPPVFGYAVTEMSGDSARILAFAMSATGITPMGEAEFIQPQGDIELTQNQTTVDVTQYATATVDVYTPTLDTLNATENGTYNAPRGHAYDQVNVTVPTGGGGTAEEKLINFIDYDGTIVDSYDATEWASATALPDNPSHDGLVAQGWNWTKAEIDSYHADYPDAKIWVGQMYITESGDTEIDVFFVDSVRLSPMLSIGVNGTVTVDWGDGTTTDTVKGTSLTTRKDVAHTYTSSGRYTICIHVVNGAFAPCCDSNNLLLRKSATTTESRVYANAIKHVRFGNGVANISSNSFYYCTSLSSVTIPNSVTSLGNDAFRNCYSLSSVTIPNSVTSINGNTLYYCYSLSNVSIPSGVRIGGNDVFGYCFSLSSVTIPKMATSIQNTMFEYCQSLSSITIPNGVTSLGNSAFRNCASLSRITIPNSVTSIVAYAFYSCTGVAEYHLLPATPPTISSNTFSSIPSDCKIYVPYSEDHSILEAYKTAQYWSAQASKMLEEPQV